MTEKPVGNEEQQAPPPEREAPQEYYGWQYDQDDATEVFQRPSGKTPPQHMQPSLPPQPSPIYPTVPPQQSPVYPPVANPLRAPQLPAQYQEPIQDMGTSLGYGQGIDRKSTRLN